ncbi:MAG: hypothetical protein JSU85_10100 [Candidatus Zixiibacteriota bacterium]|nr:MAG: hypothetical protein JSU85_10100 [candidate division Zixibacteria bacterium]
MKRFIFCSTLMICMIGFLAISFAQDTGLQPADDVQPADTVASENQEVSSEKVVASYLHGNRRCMTCRKLEAYSEEALTTAFQEELEDSTLIWRTVNYDQKENEHYLKDYSLYTKALILSRVKDGSEVEWKNLAKIWKLVGNKEEFLKYVQKETRAFMDKETD